MEARNEGFGKKEKDKNAYSNYINKWEFVSQTPYITINHDGGHTYAVSTITDSFANFVLSTNLKSDDADSIITTMENVYTANGKSFCWIAPHGEPQFEIALKLHGFEYNDSFKCMYLENITDTSLIYNMPNNITITQVRSEAALSDWLQPFKAGLSDIGLEHCKSVFNHLLNDERMEHYIASREGIPVSSCSLYLDKATSTAGIHNRSETPDQETCKALVMHSLFRAKDRGYKSAVLNAEPSEENLFEDIGFETCLSHKIYSKQG